MIYRIKLPNADIMSILVSRKNMNAGAEKISAITQHIGETIALR
jgi:hypothetical protein